MSRTLLFITALIAMFSAARAFSTPYRAIANRGFTAKFKPTSFVARSMSTTEGDETSIVDTCKEKIMNLLETDDVKVTGK